MGNHAAHDELSVLVLAVKLLGVPRLLLQLLVELQSRFLALLLGIAPLFLERLEVFVVALCCVVPLLRSVFASWLLCRRWLGFVARRGLPIRFGLIRLIWLI